MPFLFNPCQPCCGNCPDSDCYSMTHVGVGATQPFATLKERQSRVWSSDPDDPPGFQWTCSSPGSPPSLRESNGPGSWIDFNFVSYASGTWTYIGPGPDTVAITATPCCKCDPGDRLCLFMPTAGVGSLVSVYMPIVFDGVDSWSGVLDARAGQCLGGPPSGETIYGKMVCNPGSRHANSKGFELAVACNPTFDGQEPFGPYGGPESESCSPFSAVYDIATQFSGCHYCGINSAGIVRLCPLCEPTTQPDTLHANLTGMDSLVCCLGSSTSFSITRESWAFGFPGAPIDGFVWHGAQTCGSTTFDFWLWMEYDPPTQSYLWKYVFTGLKGGSDCATASGSLVVTECDGALLLDFPLTTFAQASSPCGCFTAGPTLHVEVTP
jgi:hypothetical protein